VFYYSILFEIASQSIRLISVFAVCEAAKRFRHIGLASYSWFVFFVRCVHWSRWAPNNSERRSSTAIGYCSRKKYYPRRAESLFFATIMLLAIAIT